MKTTIELTGLLEHILEKAVDAGLARSKTDALRIGVIELNHNYHLIEDEEAEAVIRKIQRVEAENKAKGKRLITHAEVLEKYPHLRDVKA